MFALASLAASCMFSLHALLIQFIFACLGEEAQIEFSFVQWVCLAVATFSINLFRLSNGVFIWFFEFPQTFLRLKYMELCQASVYLLLTVTNYQGCLSLTSTYCIQWLILTIHSFQMQSPDYSSTQTFLTTFLTTRFFTRRLVPSLVPSITHSMYQL